MQTLKFKRIHPTVQLPRYAHATDAGLDIYLPDDLTLAANERQRIDLGFALALPADTVGLILEKRSRSNEGIKLFAGVTDEAFRGELKLILWNTNQDELSYTAGTPIAQLVIFPILHPKVEEVEELSETARGSGGFGSTYQQVDGAWVPTVGR